MPIDRMTDRWKPDADNAGGCDGKLHAHTHSSKHALFQWKTFSRRLAHADAGCVWLPIVWSGSIGEDTNVSVYADQKSRGLSLYTKLCITTIIVAGRTKDTFYQWPKASSAYECASNSSRTGRKKDDDCPLMTTTTILWCLPVWDLAVRTHHFQNSMEPGI